MKPKSKEKLPLYKVGDWCVYLYSTWTVVSYEKSFSGNKFFYRLQFEKSVVTNVPEEEIKLYHAPSNYSYKEIINKLQRGEVL